MDNNKNDIKQPKIRLLFALPIENVEITKLPRLFRNRQIANNIDDIIKVIGTNEI